VLVSWLLPLQLLLLVLVAAVVLRGDLMGVGICLLHLAEIE
jgi:hypothetical protein